MRAGTENRTKTIAAGTLGVGALIAIVYLYNALFGGSAPAPTRAPVVTSAPTTAGGRTAGSAGPGTATGANTTAGLGAAPGVGAARLVATGSSSLDPTLDEAAMLRTENLSYTGTGRNIFSATYTPAATVPKNVPPPRPAPERPIALPKGFVAPPSLPPIPLKFFGTARRGSGKLQAFFLSGDDVYLASEGDIVARKYKIVSIAPNGANVEDLQNNNTVMIPLQTQ